MRRLTIAILALALSGCGGPGYTPVAAPQNKNSVTVDLNTDRIYAQDFNDGADALDKKSWAEAIADETRAIQRNPNLYPAYIDRGIAYAHQGNNAAAIADFTKAIDLAKSHGSGNYADSLSEDDLGDHHASAVIIYPAYAGRAEVYENTGQYTLAVADYSSAIAQNTPTAKVKGQLYNGRCWARARQGDLPAALQDCNQALALAPNEPEILDSRGFVYLKMGKYDLSMTDYHAALAMDPKQATSLYGLGLAMRAVNDPGAAQKIAQAEAINPNVAAILGF
jgi:tetratricopeptide (TPR) repeat protein